MNRSAVLAPDAVVNAPIRLPHGVTTMEELWPVMDLPQPDTMEKYRKVVMGALLIEVRGRVEYDEDVLHVIAARLVDATDQLQRLSDDLLKPAIAHGDHAGPLPELPEHFRQGHPRNVRVIPKSRDFH